MNKLKLILVSAVAGTLLAGCVGWPIRWQATEPQKQAADLAVQDLQQLRGRVDTGAEPVRAEGETAARVTQTYVGLPAQPVRPQTPAATAATDQAAIDAARPLPTVGHAIEVVGEQAEVISEATFGLVDRLLTIAASVAGAWGLGKARGGIINLKTKAATAEEKVALTLAALGETVKAIDEAKATLTPEERAKLLAALKGTQSPDAKKLVAEIRAGP